MSLLSSFDNITGWQVLQKNSAAIEKAYASTSNQAAQIAYFEKIAPTLTTPEALLSNYRALDFVTTAYGLGGEVGETALLKKLMTQDPKSSSSLAQQLSDNNYRNFADALSTWSPPPFSDQTNIAAAVAGFQQHSFDTAIGQDNSALQSAEYFTQNAKGLTTLAQVMADPVLVDVVTTALGIPFDSYGELDYTQQVQILTPRVDMKDFATSAGIQKLATQFLAMNEVNQSNSGTTTTSTTSSSNSDPLLTLFSSAARETGSSTGLTLSSGMLDLLA